MIAMPEVLSLARLIKAQIPTLTAVLTVEELDATTTPPRRPVLKPEDVAFLVPKTDSLFPCLTTNNKTVFFVVIDACEHGAQASKRGTLKTYEITENELVQAVGEGS